MTVTKKFMYACEFCFKIGLNNVSLSRHEGHDGKCCHFPLFATGWSVCPGVQLEGKCYEFVKGPMSVAEAEVFTRSPLSHRRTMAYFKKPTHRRHIGLFPTVTVSLSACSSSARQSSPVATWPPSQAHASRER